MATNLMSDGSPRAQLGSAGAYYRISLFFAVKRLTPNEYGITNTMAWLADGRFVTADTVENTLYAFQQSDGGLADRTVFNAGFDHGLPDGSALDEEGFLWNCRVAGGGCLVRFASDGRIDRILELPCSWPTSCAFGGQRLDKLFVASARFTMAADHLATRPLEGALFSLDVGVPGVPPDPFG